jgi:polyisoprenoid-binding protein YceI
VSKANAREPDRPDGIDLLRARLDIVRPTVTGKLTLHGVTKPVTLNVVVNKVGQNPLDKIDSAGFSARGTFKRSDFGMKTYLGAIGDDVDLIIEIEAKKKS